MNLELEVRFKITLTLVFVLSDLFQHDTIIGKPIFLNLYSSRLNTLRLYIEIYMINITNDKIVLISSESGKKQTDFSS